MEVEGGGNATASEQAWAKVDELNTKFTDLLTKRRQLFDAIKAMNPGEQKDAAVREFNEIEDSLVVSYIFPGVRKIFGSLGYSGPSMDLPGTLGILPALWAAFVGASWATQALVAASAVLLIGYIAEVTLRYGAMIVRPSIAAQIREPGIASQVGDVSKVAVYGVIALVAAYLFLPMLKKSKG